MSKPTVRSNFYSAIELFLKLLKNWIFKYLKKLTAIRFIIINCSQDLRRKLSDFYHYYLINVNVNPRFPSSCCFTYAIKIINFIRLNKIIYLADFSRSVLSNYCIFWNEFWDAFITEECYSRINHKIVEVIFRPRYLTTLWILRLRQPLDGFFLKTSHSLYLITGQ